MPSQPIFQFYAELDEYKPKIWRRFQVTNEITMARFGYILMTLFEMKAEHLFCFELPLRENYERYIRKRATPEELDNLFSQSFPAPHYIRYEIPFDDEPPYLRENEKFCDARDSKVKHSLGEEGDRVVFSYDYGDNWLVSLTLEEIIDDKELPKTIFPRVLEGEGFGIVEDCGGVTGLQELAKAFKKKKGAAYKSFSEWLGVDDLDMDSFDLDDMNFRLRKIPRIYMQVYEQRLTPTQRSIDLIERRYQKKVTHRFWIVKE